MTRHVFLLLTALIMSAIPAFARDYSATFSNADPEQTVSILRKTTGYDFVYQKSMLENNKAKVNGDYKNLSLTQLLDQTIVYQLNMSYKITGNTVTINKADESAKTLKRTVKGVVLDPEGEPLPGATITLKGKADAIVTDIDGNFSMNVDGHNPVLVVNYLGMHPREIALNAVNPSSPLKIVLSPNVNLISEVVVTGYQNLKRENATGAFQQISSKDLETRYMSSLSQNLEGKIAGMVVYNDNINIRGTGTLVASTSPLVVVDGLPIEGTLDDVNPYEVDKVTVLKDAAAAAIYGARASNGVIVVTTKKGLSSKMSVEFNADFTIHEKLDYNDLNLVNAEELLYLEEQNFNWMINNPDANSYLQDQYNLRGGLWQPMNKLMMRHYLGEVSDADYNSQLALWRRNSYSRDWQENREHNRLQQRYNVAIRTKGKYLNNNIVINWSGDNTNDVNAYNNKLSLRYLGDVDITRWFNASLGLQVDNTRQKGSYQGQFDMASFNSFPEYLSVYNPDGTPARLQALVDLSEPSLSDPNLGLKDEGYVPLNEFDLNTSKYRQTYTRGYVHLNFFPIPELKLSGMFQYEDATYKRENTMVGESYSARHLYNLFTDEGEHKLPDGGIYREINNTQSSYTFRTQATYDKTLFEKHAINAIAGIEYRHQRIKSTTHSYYGYDEQNLVHNTGNVNFDDLVNSSTTDLGTLYSAAYVFMADDFGNFNDIEHKYFSYYFTGNYTYDHRYSVSGSYRIDRADLFGADKKFTRRPLWSFGASWNAQNEEFLNDCTWLDLLKPRFSYGVTGNINSNYTSYLTAAIYTNSLIRSKRARLSTPPNDQLRWEKTKTTNIGIDFALWGYRLSGSVDYYNKEGSDILSLVDLDPTTGWSSLNMNNAGTRNRGFEIQLNSQILRAHNPRQVGLNLEFTLAHNDNKITSLNHVSTRGIDAIQTDDYKEGRPVNALYSYMYDGVRYDEEGYGHIYWKKANGESYDDNISSGNFTADDVVFSGNLDPKWSGSLTPTVTWRNFSLSAMTAFYLGHYFRPNYNKWTFSYDTSYGSRPTREYLNYWEAPENERATMIGNGYVMSQCSLYPQNVYYSDKHVAHADYLKLRNIVLTYSFPQNICKKMGMSSLRLRAQMNNVATWVRNSEGVDPERVEAATGIWSIGAPRSYTFSINANF